MNSPQHLDEGFLDFLKRLWRSITGRSDQGEYGPGDDFNGSVGQMDGYAGDERLDSEDPKLKEKLARVFIRGVQLHKEAARFGVRDPELIKILVSVWKGKIKLNDFLKLKQSGVIDRIYSRVRERTRYQKRKRGMLR